MSLTSLPRALSVALRRLVPPRFHTRGMDAGRRVARLTPAQRELLARNLRQMLRPKTA